ncbi:DeoR/GlpR transcriptional regulator [Pantoea sp. Taur]|nr:DeoR/GlpR transcriptional regulator [Pantoea sp. Taur]
MCVTGGNHVQYHPSITMIPAERHQHIIEALREQSFLSMATLAQMLSVSEMTIRRDVAELSSRGALLAVRGGVKSLAIPTSGSMREIENRLLLRAALSYLEGCRVIFFDSGVICRQLAHLIPWSSGMTAVTNDFNIAHDIMRHTQAQLLFIGGELNRNDSSCHKVLALNSLEKLNFELLFLSPGSWNEKGIWHHEEHRQAWYSQLMSISHRKVILAESGNYDQRGMFKLYSLADADVVISNKISIERLLNGSIDPLKLHPVSPIV